MEHKGLTIGELSGRTGVGVEALRFYERKGILPSPTRDASGYRRYREEDVVRVRFIRRAKELGFTLAEIHELLELRATDKTSCEEVQTIARDKITDLNIRVRSLTSITAALEKLTDMCGRGGTEGDCPFLNALDDAGDWDPVI